MHCYCRNRIYLIKSQYCIIIILCFTETNMLCVPPNLRFTTFTMYFDAFTDKTNNKKFITNENCITIFCKILKFSKKNHF